MNDRLWISSAGLNTGDWPSGKATGSGPVIGGSNPSSPAKHSILEHRLGVLLLQ